MTPDRDTLETALRIIAGLPVFDGPGLAAFADHYMRGWHAPPGGINEAVGPLKSNLKKKAIDCLLDALAPTGVPGVTYFSVARGIPLPAGRRVYLDGVDITPAATEFDTAGGWATVYTMRNGWQVPESQHRVRGRVELRPA